MRAVGGCCFTGTGCVAIDKESGLKVAGGKLGIMIGDSAGFEEVGTVENVVDAGNRAKVGNAVGTGAGGGVNVGTPNAGKYLKVETVLDASGGVIGTAWCVFTALLEGVVVFLLSTRASQATAAPTD